MGPRKMTPAMSSLIALCSAVPSQQSPQEPAEILEVARDDVVVRRNNERFHRGHWPNEEVMGLGCFLFLLLQPQ